MECAILWATQITSYTYEETLMTKITIDLKLCKGCGICVELCPRKVLKIKIDMDTRGYHTPEAIHEDSCTVCGLCEMYCPDFAISPRSTNK